MEKRRHLLAALSVVALASACAGTPKEPSEAGGPTLRVPAPAVTTTTLRDVSSWTISYAKNPFRAAMVGRDRDGDTVVRATFERRSSGRHRYAITTPESCVIRTTPRGELDTLYRTRHDDSCAVLFHDIATHFRALVLPASASDKVGANSPSLRSQAVAPMAAPAAGEGGGAFGCIQGLAQANDPSAASFESGAASNPACAGVFEEPDGGAPQGVRMKYMPKKNATRDDGDGGRVACEDKRLCITMPSAKESPLVLSDCEGGGGGGAQASNGYVPTNITFRDSKYLMGFVGTGVGELVCITAKGGSDPAAAAAPGASQAAGEPGVTNCDFSALEAAGSGTNWYKEAPLAAAEKAPSEADAPEPVTVVNRADGRCLVAEGYRDQAKLQVTECTDEESVKRWVFDSLNVALPAQ